MGQSKFKIEWKFAAHINYNNKEELSDCHVVECKLNLIGLPWLKKLNLLKNIVNFNVIENNTSKMKKIVWEKRKPMPKLILQQKLWNGKKVYCLMSVLMRKIENIKQDNIESK